jgi:hypothetical protein
MSTQPTEAHKTQASMWLAAFRHRFHPSQTLALAQLLADSEARAVQSAIRDTPWAANYLDMERALVAERAKVRVLREALERVHHEGDYTAMCIADAALAATEEGAT